MKRGDVMTKEEIGRVLKELRISCGMTQKEVARQLGRNQPIVGHWETGYAQPDANTLFTLCDLYGTTVDEAFGFIRKNNNISITEYNIIKKYRSLDDLGRNHVDTILTWETERMSGQSKPNEDVIVLAEYETSHAPTYTIPYWESGVSAGNGIYQLNDSASTMMTLWASELTKQADFIIKVSGNSMEPDYHDGDKVLVNRKSYVDVGEVGIFVKNGDTYIKEMGIGELISRNPEYSNIPVNDFDNVVCLGKVIGILKNDMIAKA